MSKTILHFSSDLGYWCDEWKDMGNNTSYKVSVLIGDTERNNILNISRDVYVPTNGDKVFFLPGVNVPRVKFRNLCDESGIKTIRDPSKANIFIANNNTINKVCDSSWEHKVPTTDFIAFIELPQFKKKVDERAYENIKTVLEFYNDEHVYVDRPTARMIGKYICQNDNKYHNSENILTILEDYKILIDHASNAIVYDESVVIDQLNGDDAAIIDDQIHAQLNVMLNSTDDDNKVLAMEIMANCKYSASLIHLIMLFHDHYNTFYSSPVKNHVNFKSLLSWLDITPSNPNISCDYAIQILRDKGQLTPDKLNKLLSYMGDEVAMRGNTDVFKMKHITLAPEILAEMGVNYSYQQQEEFNAPAVVEEEEVELIGEEEVPESEFAAEDNFDLEGPEEGQNDPIVIEAISETVTQELKQEVPSNNQEINTNESSVDWF